MSTKVNFEAIDYKENLRGAGFLCIDHAGLILLEGESRIDYLQRQTSNDLDQLEEGKAVPNILPNPNGQVIEVFINIEWDNGIALLCPAHRGPQIIDYFQKRIFFNDRVSLTNISKDWAQFLILGKEADERMKSIFDFPSTIKKNELQIGHFKDQKVFGIGLRESGGLASKLLLVPTGESESVKRDLISGEINEISKLEFERFRIMNGIAGPQEYSGSFTPFELGLDEFVSNSKGCYTGQEVLARQINFNKIAKVRATLLAEEKIESGDKILMSGQEIGTVSSTSTMPDGQTIGLAIVKKTKAEKGSIVSVKRGETPAEAEIKRIF